MEQNELSHEPLLEVTSELLKLAKTAGVDLADSMASYGTDFEVKVESGKIGTLTQATAKAVGLRVFVGKKLGFCTTSDFRKSSLQALVERTVAMAHEVEEDEFNDIARAESGTLDAGSQFDPYDPSIAALSTDEKIRMAHTLEQAARDTDSRVQKFRDSGIASGESWSALQTSTGTIRTTRGTGISAWCNPIAEADGQLQTEVWYDSRAHLEDLESMESIGQNAAARAARMLGAKPVATQKAAVIFEPMIAAGLLGGLIGAINGDLVYKKASFLGDKLGEQIASPDITMIDDPHVYRGLASTPFDGEGLPTYPKRILDRGKLTTFLYDSYTARKVGVSSTANGRRGATGMPSIGTYNFCIEPGQTSLKEMLSSVPRALILTRGLGRGLNAITGEYSRGANGLWVENGEIVHAVQEVTIAGNLLEMLQNVDCVGNDLMVKGSTRAPSIRIQDMTISGS
ncbi:MAG: TldD/PmbA family protein [Deltaproteobacteria bacterium]|jgi:PmbA protein|nr:TldD/PmbA family protein [Deltaproteobacteria bacterium]MBT6435902.1 TldD/PmbA family protein [Deltaproteobacteria bacterium]MBT6491911.1 TldD/PmbA family protein [Deltaproteobacteria bacterium]